MSALQPHRKRSWLTPPPDDPVELTEQICTVCEVYEATPALAAQGVVLQKLLSSAKLNV